MNSPDSLDSRAADRARPSGHLRSIVTSCFLALAMLLVLTAGVTQAGTIWIVGGPDVPPAGGVYTDGHVRALLTSGNVLLDTDTANNTGPDDIRVEASATITWTSPFTLELRAGNDIVVSSTIRHDGPITGVGGLRLIADWDGDGTGTVFIGTGTQVTGVVAGSRYGLTRVEGASLQVMAGAAGSQRFAQLGLHAEDQTEVYTATGPISITVSHQFSLTAGSGLLSYAQIGHGGGYQTPGSTLARGIFGGAISIDAGQVALVGGGDNAYAQMGHGGLFATGNHSGSHTLHAFQSVVLQAGLGENAYVQFGNGGLGADGNHTGDHILQSAQDVRVAAGNGNRRAYAQFGNGGFDANGSHDGDHSLAANGSVEFRAGNLQAYVQFGNGGQFAIGNYSGSQRLMALEDVAFLGGNGEGAYALLGNGGHSASGTITGSHVLSTSGNVTFQAGSSDQVFVQLGNGGYETNGDLTGSHTLNTGGNVRFIGDGDQSYAQLGNGGYRAVGNHQGSHGLRSAGGVGFEAGGLLAYAQMGNGGYQANGDQTGNHTVEAASGITYRGGSTNSAYAQLGNGGLGTDGNHSGDLIITATLGLTMTAGAGTNAYSLLGHGDAPTSDTFPPAPGERAGDVIARVGESATFHAAGMGHVTAGGILSITQGNTWLGVGLNRPDATSDGRMLVSSALPTRFTSAPGGELRFYLPRADSQQIPTTTTFNDLSFAVANVIPEERIVGYYRFGDGPYAAPYSFYLAGLPGVAIGKTVTPSVALPGEPVTYTIAFSNSGTYTATQIVISDTLPRQIEAASVYSVVVPPGVAITQTSGSATPYVPLYRWTVTDLGAGQGGVITLTGLLSTSLDLLGAVFTNTATITTTAGVSPAIDTSAAVLRVQQSASLSVTKVVLGAVPAAGWRFSGPAGPFILPSAGGAYTLTGLLAARYIVSETVDSQYVTSSACDDGSTGDDAIAVNLLPGVSTACFFTNTERAGLSVTKVVVGAVPTASWQFTGPAGPFVLPSAGGTYTVTDLPAAQYIVSETVDSLYVTSSACDDGSTGDGAITVNLWPGVSTACVFTNTERSSLEPATLAVTKTVEGQIPESAWSFTGSDAIGPFTLPPGGGSTTFVVPAGVYTIAETIQASYVTAVTCRGGGSSDEVTGDASVSVTLAPGAYMDCTFTNTFDEPVQPVGIVRGIVYRDHNGNGEWDEGEGDLGARITLSNELQATATTSPAVKETVISDYQGNYRFEAVPPGLYTLTVTPFGGSSTVYTQPVEVDPGMEVQLEPILLPEPEAKNPIYLPFVVD